MGGEKERRRNSSEERVMGPRNRVLKKGELRELVSIQYIESLC